MIRAPGVALRAVFLQAGPNATRRERSLFERSFAFASDMRVHVTSTSRRQMT